MAESRNKREIAHRAFVFELKDSTVTFKEGESAKAPVFLLTPTGGLFNRVLICGAVLDTDQREGKSEFWIAQINDRTDTIQVTAGEYNPEAMAAISRLEAPMYVAVVGKPNVWEKDDKRYISIRAESVSAISESEMRKWILDAAEATVRRLEVLKQGEEETARKAALTYGMTRDDINDYKRKLIGVLDTLMPKPPAIEVKPEPLEIVDLRPRK